MTANNIPEEEIIEIALKVFKMNDPLIQKSTVIRRTMQNKLLYERFEEIAKRIANKLNEGGTNG